MPAPLPSLAGSIVLKAVADLPARLYGGNAQEVTVTGLDYTLHLDISKLPTSAASPATGKWTVVWDALEDTYKRIEFTNLPAGPTAPVITGGGIVFSARSDIPSSLIDPLIPAISTQGFSEPGDSGEGLYDRMASPPADTTNPAYVQSLDGAWWRLVPQGGTVYIEQFGGKADYDAAKTDNLGPIRNAHKFFGLAITAGNSYTYTLQFGVGRYYVSDTLDINVISNWVGHSSGITGQTREATQLIWPQHKTFVIWQSINTGPGPTSNAGTGSTANGSTVTGIQFSSPGLADDNLPGLLLRTRIDLRNVSVVSSAGPGVAVHAGSQTPYVFNGNANCTVFDTVACLSTGGNGFEFMGSEVNACNFYNLFTQGPTGGCGIFDLSGLGNHFFGAHIAGYGNSGVFHLGVAYQLVFWDAANTTGGATTPGTNPDVWYPLRSTGAASANFPQWVSGAVYKVGLPLYASGFSNRSVYEGVYIEGGAVVSYFGGPQMSMGGQHGLVPGNACISHSGIAGPVSCGSGIGASRTYEAGGLGYNTMGPTAFTYVGGHPYTDMSMLWHFKAGPLNDGEQWCMNYDGRRIRYGRGQPGTAQPDIWDIYESGHVGVGDGHPLSYNKNVMGLHDMVLRHIFAGGQSKRFAVRTSAPVNNDQQHINEYTGGDTIYIGGTPQTYVCTTGGALGWIWASGNTYARVQLRPEIIKTAAGRFYTLITQGPGASTIEPVHVSGDNAPGADGYVWRYTTATQAVFTSAVFPLSEFEALQERVAALEAAA
jgi:hypothetical protein